MPKVTYQPEGVETPKEWDFKPGRMLSPEMGAIEKHTGMLFPEWVEKFQRGSTLAIHAFLYVMLKRENPTLKFDDVVFCLDEVSFDLSDEEAVRYATALAALPERTPEEQAQLDDLIAKGHAPAPEGEGDPKDATA